MASLADAVQALGLSGDLSVEGRWLELRTEHCTVFVVEATWGPYFYTWCDTQEARAAAYYRDPVEAIQAGLRRAAQAPRNRPAGPAARDRQA